jgi:hypothetical protein
LNRELGGAVGGFCFDGRHGDAFPFFPFLGECHLKDSFFERILKELRLNERIYISAFPWRNDACFDMLTCRKLNLDGELG